MSDPFDAAARGLMIAAAGACLVTAAIVRPHGLPTGVRAGVMQQAAAQANGGHAQAHTFVIDGVSSGSGEKPFDARAIVVRRGMTVEVRGWAIDPVAPRSAAGFAVRVDDGAWQAATYHLARPDVANALGLANAADSGFLVRVPTRSLRAGLHVLTLATVAANGERAVLPQQIRLDVRAG